MTLNKDHEKTHRERMAMIDSMLATRFDEAPAPKRRPALDELIRTILSQNTNDANTNRAFEAMCANYSDWADVLAAPRADLEAVLRPGGLAQTKAARIQRLLGVLATRGPLNLDFLDAWETEAVEQWLLEFDGVGYKTARCVLLFALGRDVFPIDTHILRVLKRVGIVAETATAEHAHKEAKDFMPKGRSHSLHINLIRLGRSVCRPRKPQCDACPIRSQCAYGQRAAA